ncbi:MAG: acireductone synthase, partial [Pyrinomonadaceae bacterium]
FISDHFDTNVGGKRESESYAKIASELGFEAIEILFVSDVAEELDAARLSGFQTVLSMRPGNAEIAGTVAHRAICGFDELS